MTNRKFFALILSCLLLFSAVITTGGCGSSSSPLPDGPYYTVTFNSNGGSDVASLRVRSGGTVTRPADPVRTDYTFSGWYKDNNFTDLFIFGPEGDKVTGNITLYAGWTEGEPASDAAYAITNVAIGYSKGNNSEYVTENLTLPVLVNGVNVQWQSSNPGTISNTGTVNRNNSDTNVTLTAAASKGSETASRTFDLVVIRARTRTVEQAKAEIQVKGLDEIRALNEVNSELQISYSANRDRITDIDGKYTDVEIHNADDALDAVWSLHGILGLNDPYEELEGSVITSDSNGAEYTFAQVYNDINVYGRNMTVSANGEGEGDFIASSTVPSSVLSGADLNFTLAQENAENTARSNYSGNVNVRSSMTEKIIYTLEDYENNPVPAYVVNVYGRNSENVYIDENVIVNALNGAIIYTSTNITGANGLDELDNYISFPVLEKTPADGSETRYYMQHYIADIGAYVEIYSGAARESNLVYRYADEQWNDKQAVSAYTNILDVMEWWKNSFNRNSLDGNGMTVKLIIHTSSDDNAYWFGSEEVMRFCDPVDNIRSYAAAAEVITHESTHAVMQYRLNTFFPYMNATGAINEGYADIFGCLYTRQWLNGDNISANGAYERNIANPYDPAAGQNQKLANIIAHSPAALSERYTGDFDNGGVHINSSLISYPAYLMKSQGMEWETLGRLWYKSMRMGYSAISDYYTVRRNVMRAAKKLQMSDTDKDIIKQAFDQVGIEEISSTITGRITDFETGNAIQGAAVKVYAGSAIVVEDTTDAEGKYTVKPSSGTYRITIEANDYLSLNVSRIVEEGDELDLNARLVKAGVGKISGRVRNALSGEYISGVTVRLIDGWSITDQYAGTSTQQTNNEGYYEMSSVDAGYYTIEASMTGYTVSTTEITIAPNSDSQYEILLSPVMTGNLYRVTLQWGLNPRDLDSHLIGRLPDGSGTFHVAYYNKEAVDRNGNAVATLDHDDVNGNGFETITFEMQPGDKFTYFVHWYAGSGTWGGSNAVVNLYRGTQLIGTFPVPDIDVGDYSYSSGGYNYWYVFDITSGMNPVQPSNSNQMTNTEPSVSVTNNNIRDFNGAVFYPPKITQ